MENDDTENSSSTKYSQPVPIQRQDSRSRRKQKVIDVLEGDSSDSKKAIKAHKIESASKLSKDLKLISSEVTGRIPVCSPASECGLETHFISQKPGCRKVRHLSSTSSGILTDKKANCDTWSKKKRKQLSCPFSSSHSSSR